MSTPLIDIEEVYGALENELEDLYAEGLISAGIRNKKTSRRLMLYAINQADSHICMRLKITAYVNIFAPKDLTTIFFDRQEEYISNLIDQYESLSEIDDVQFGYFLSETSSVNIVSVNNTYAEAYGEIPLQGSKSGKRIHNALSEELEAGRGYGQTFYIDSNQRKMILSSPFSEDMWIRANAQIAPVRFQVLKASKSQIEKYQILSPYYCQQWLIDRAMINILSRRAAQEAGFYESEARTSSEAIQNQPSTGNVIIPGNELSGNYESSFEDI